jgi:hypothetical protein
MKLTEENRSTRGKNLSLCHFVDHKSHMDWPGIEPGPGLRGERPATNRLSHEKVYNVALTNSFRPLIHSHSYLLTHVLILFLFCKLLVVEGCVFADVQLLACPVSIPRTTCKLIWSTNAFIIGGGNHIVRGKFCSRASLSIRNPM